MRSIRNPKRRKIFWHGASPHEQACLKVFSSVLREERHCRRRETNCSNRLVSWSKRTSPLPISRWNGCMLRQGSLSGRSSLPGCIKRVVTPTSNSYRIDTAPPLHHLRAKTCNRFQVDGSIWTAVLGTCDQQ